MNKIQKEYLVTVAVILLEFSLLILGIYFGARGNGVLSGVFLGVFGFVLIGGTIYAGYQELE